MASLPDCLALGIQRLATRPAARNCCAVGTSSSYQKELLYPFPSDCTIKGIVVRHGAECGTDGPEVASKDLGATPNERGRMWAASKRKGQNVEERLKSLMQDLGNAINESLSDSERIAEAIGEIKRAGYDVFLVLEATIGFNKRDEAEEAETEEVSETETESSGRVRFTSQDQRFLKALRIAVDEEA